MLHIVSAKLEKYLKNKTNFLVFEEYPPKMVISYCKISFIHAPSVWQSLWL